MNVFTPYANPYKNAKCLDVRRRNKQILEIIQIICANTGIDVGWKIPKNIKNHPNVLKWKGFEDYLLIYCYIFLYNYYKEKNKIHKAYFAYEHLLCKLHSRYWVPNKRRAKLPPWFTKESCYEHQALLISKKPEFYGQIFNKK